MLTLIYEERDPSTTLAWVLILLLFPGLGVVALRAVRPQLAPHRASATATRRGTAAGRRDARAHLRAPRRRRSPNSSDATRRSSADSSRRFTRRTAPSRSPASTSRSSRRAPRSSRACSRHRGGHRPRPPRVLHLGAGRADRAVLQRCSPRRSRRASRCASSTTGSARCRTASSQLKALRKAGAQRPRRCRAVDQAQLPQPPQDRRHRRAHRLHRRHEHGTGVHRRQAALRVVARHARALRRPARRRAAAPVLRALVAGHARGALLGAVLPRARRTTAAANAVWAQLAHSGPESQLAGGAQRVPARDRLGREARADPVAVLRPRRGRSRTRWSRSRSPAWTCAS